MNVLLSIHSILGERVLPVVILIVAIWLTISWKPNAPVSPLARFFPILIDIQVLLGLITYVILLVGGNPKVLSFPFILHPILGLVAAFVAHRAVKGGGFMPKLGRWASLASLVILLALVIANLIIARLG